MASEQAAPGGPKPPSRIPVRRELSLPSSSASLPSTSGRSTPCGTVSRPPMQREASSPPGLLRHAPARPPLPPKPKLSAPPSLARGRSRPQEGCGDGQSGRSTPSQGGGTPSLERGSKIPRPEGELLGTIRKWDSTSCLELCRQNSDLGEGVGPSLRKQALTHSSSVNLPRASSLYGSTSNLSSRTALRGSNPNLASSSRMVRSCSSSSFTTVEDSKARQRQKSILAQSQVDLSQEARGKAALSRTGTKPKAKGVQDQVSKLQQDLEDSRRLVTSLREEVGQKETIAAMAVGQTKVHDYEAMYAGLSREHTRLAAKGRDAELRANRLKEELGEARDAAELLEFRLLELEGRESRERTPELCRKVEAGTETEDTTSLHSFPGDSGCSSQASSADLGDIQKDFRNEKIGDTKLKLQALMDSIPEPGGRALLLQTVALFETLLARIHSLQGEAKVLKEERDQLTLALEAKSKVETELRSAETKLLSANEEVQETLQKLFSSDRRLQEVAAEGEKKETTARQVTERSAKVEADLRREAESLGARLESVVQGHRAESDMYAASLERLSHQERTIKGLEARLEEQAAEIATQGRRDSVTSGESREFPHIEGTSLLSDSSFDETSNKTTGSSSGVSSDLSDSDNDSPDYKERFIESGIFEEEELEAGSREATTQTLEVDQQMSQLNQEIVKLTQIRSLVEQRVSPSTKEAEEVAQPTTGGREESPLSKVSEYGSCEELEMINGAGRYDHQAELRGLSGKLREMEQKWEVLYTAHQEVVEERCELEEAENDSRLRAQKLETQYNGALERSQIIKDELILERQNSEELKYQLDDLLRRDERSQEDLESLQLHIQEQEAVIRELEEREMYFSEQLHLLEMGVRISGWWRTWSWLLDPVEEGEEEELRKDEVMALLEDQRVTAGEERAEAKEMEEQLTVRIQGLQEEYDGFLNCLGQLVLGQGKEVEGRKGQVVAKVKALLQTELSLKKQVSDLEKKEMAYSKTIQEADTIMARVELSYQERIAELEQEKHDLKEKLWEVEERTGAREELMGRLQQVEQTEAALREKVRLLEEEREEMRSKVAELEASNARVRHEVKDQEELVRRICEMDGENQELVLELARLKEVDQKLVCLREVESRLRCRLQELEESEQRLRGSLELGEGRKELELQQQEEVHVDEGRGESEEREGEYALREQVDSLKLQIRDLETEVQARSEELDSVETGYRSEVSSLKASLEQQTEHCRELEVLRKQLQGQVQQLQHEVATHLAQVVSRGRREDQELLRWNLLLGEREDAISCLKEQVGAMDQEELDTLAAEQEELDTLAEEEGGLGEVVTSLASVLNTVQACPPCSGAAAAQLDSAICQLAQLTQLLGGEARLSYRSSLDREELLPSSSCSSRSSVEREGGSISSSSLCSQDREWRYATTYSPASPDQECESERSYRSFPRPSPPPCRRQGSTSILLERGQEGDITSIVRLDSQQPPAILFSKDIQEAEFVPESAVTYHNYTGEWREEGSQTERVAKEEGGTQTERREAREEASQTEEDTAGRRRRESRELAFTLAQGELAELAAQLEMEQAKSEEQVSEIQLLSRRVDQLQRRGSGTTVTLQPGQGGSFIIKNLQSQVQELDEKNSKKDSLIKKLAETVVRSPERHSVIDSLRTATVKPSDRRIDFDIETLLNFLEKRKLSSRSSSSSLFFPSPSQDSSQFRLNGFASRQ